MSRPPGSPDGETADERERGETGRSDGASGGRPGGTLAGLLGTVAGSARAGGSDAAASDGDWSDPSTWKSGSVPTDGAAVVIPSGVTVTVASEVSTRVTYVDVRGTLRHAPDTDTTFRAETIQTRAGSRYEIGTPARPVRSDVTATVEIIDQGPIDETEWPDRRNKGLLARGDVEIVGAEKTPWTTLAQPPTAGDSVIELPAEPTNWTAGDTLVVPDLDPYEPTALDHDDEKRTIAAVSGTTVTLESPLDHDHVPPKTAFDSYVLNLSRNVRMVSENTDEKRRGHVMLMDTATDVRYARLTDLGRTNKAEPLTDPPRNADAVEADDPNTRARYAFHYHETGIGADPHYAEGIVVDGSPGWGVVNHHAHAEVVDSITYDVLGAGFVAEGGNERGSFRNCVAVRSAGSGERIDDRAAGAHGGDPPIDDFGHAGHGFWLQSPLLRVVDCVAGGHRHQAFVWWLRPLLDGDLAEGTTVDDSRVTYHPNLPWQYCDTDRPLFEAIDRDRFANGRNNDVMRTTRKIPSTFANVGAIRGNVAFGSAGGADFSRHNFKWKHERYSDFNAIEDMTVHGIGTFFDGDGTVHEASPPRHLSVGHQGRGGSVGVQFRYTSNVTLRDSHVVGSGRANSLAVPYHDYLWYTLVENSTIENWDWGLVTGEHSTWWIRNNTLRNNTYDVDWNVDNVGPAILEDNDTERIRYRYTHENVKASLVFGSAHQRGMRIDGQTAYFEKSAPDYVPFPDPGSLDGVNHLDDYFDTDPANLVGLTNQEIHDQYGEVLGGRMVPPDAESDAGVAGGVLATPHERSPPTSAHVDSTTADSLGPFEVVRADDVTGGTALRSTGSSSPRDDPASVSFECAAGVYEVYFRFRPDAWNGDDIHYRIDGGDWHVAEKLKDPAGFDWHGAAPNNGATHEHDLSEGQHTLAFACGNDGALLDEIFIGSATDEEVLGAYGLSADDDGTLSITADGDRIDPGGEADLSITGRQVDRITVTQLWTDWAVDESRLTSGSLTDRIATAGEVEIDWDSTQASVSLGLPVSLPSRYVGGTYVLTVTATDGSGSVRATPTIVVN